MEIVSEIGDSTLNGLNYIGSLASLGGRAASEANQALTHIDAMVGENRPDVRQAVLELRRTLTNMTDTSARLDQTLDANSGNIDEVLDNMRHVTENLKEFTSTIKTRPYTLIRASNPRQHKPGEQQ